MVATMVLRTENVLSSIYACFHTSVNIYFFPKETLSLYVRYSSNISYPKTI